MSIRPYWGFSPLPLSSKGRAAQELKRLTHSEVVLLADGRIAASTLARPASWKPSSGSWTEAPLTGSDSQPGPQPSFSRVNISSTPLALSARCRAERRQAISSFPPTKHSLRPWVGHATNDFAHEPRRNTREPGRDRHGYPKGHTAFERTEGQRRKQLERVISPNMLNSSSNDESGELAEVFNRNDRQSEERAQGARKNRSKPSRPPQAQLVQSEKHSRLGSSWRE